MHQGKEEPRPALAGAAAGAVEADSTTLRNEQERSTKPQPRKYAPQRAWKKRNPLATWAHAAFRSAERRGLVQRTPCEVCGAEDTDAHHYRGYHQPLAVRFLCRRHHKAAHKAERRRARGDG